jgi:uncharacterized secreted repeat protein (TIGR03808 family)
MMPAMAVDRRRLLLGSLSGAAVLATPATAATPSAFGRDVTHFGVRPGSPDDQTTRLQRAIDEAARTRAPLWLPPGVYKAGNLKLPAGAQLFGVREQTRLVLAGGRPLFSAAHAQAITLSGLVLDGEGRPLPARHGLVHLEDVRALRIADCSVMRAGGDGLALAQCDGAVTLNLIVDAANNALFCNDSRGMVITTNVIRGAGNGGIRVWQSEKRRDGSIVADNRIEDTAARAGGSGQNGNAINVYRAADVIVRGNHIDKAAFSAIRGNAASNIQMIGNNCSNLGEVALYAEFDFEGAVIASNTVQRAEIGVVTTNFNEGGRLAVVQGNLIRDMTATAPQGGSAGIGIAVEADAAVTGNVIENAPGIGISLGTGKYLRDVTVTGNVVRRSGIGIGVSVSAGAGAAVIAGNMIAGAQRGAIIGMEWKKPVTGDLALAGADRYSQLRISNNQAD